MRELGLWDAGEALSLVFGDVEELAAQCRFPDCGHTNEPGCAVRAALEDGRLSSQMWRDYQAQQKEARFVEDRSAYLKRKQEFQKTIARNNRSRKR